MPRNSLPLMTLQQQKQHESSKTSWGKLSSSACHPKSQGLLLPSHLSWLLQQWMHLQPSRKHCKWVPLNVEKNPRWCDFATYLSHSCYRCCRCSCSRKVGRKQGHASIIINSVHPSAFALLQACRSGRSLISQLQKASTPFEMTLGSCSQCHQSPLSAPRGTLRMDCDSLRMD